MRVHTSFLRFSSVLRLISAVRSCADMFQSGALGVALPDEPRFPSREGAHTPPCESRRGLQSCLDDEWLLKIFSRKVAPAAAGGAEISVARLRRAKAKKVRGGPSCPAGAAASAAVRAARASRKGPRRPRTPRSSRPPSTPAPRPPWHRCLTSSKLLTITIPSLRQCARPIWRGASRSGARLSCRRLPKPGGFREAVAAAD